MLSTKTINIIGYISLAIMLVLLLLLWFRIVPESYAIPFAIIAGALFLMRFALRILVMRRLRNDKRQSSS